MNIFGIKSKEDRARERDLMHRVKRANNVKMMKEAIDATAPAYVPDIIATLLLDDDRLTPRQLEDLSNRIGREAHDRARRKI